MFAWFYFTKLLLIVHSDLKWKICGEAVADQDDYSRLAMLSDFQKILPVIQVAEWDSFESYRNNP